MDIQAAKELVIKAGKEVVASGLIARTWGNISCRVSDTQFVITPSGRPYEGLTPEEIVLVNIADLSYDGVLCLLDVDNWKTECYEIATSKLRSILGHRPDEEALFNNPNTLQLLLSPFTDEVMDRSDKAGYSDLVHRCFPLMKGVYRASGAQLRSIYKAYSREAYLALLEKTESYSRDPHDLPSSTFAPFLRKIEERP